MNRKTSLIHIKAAAVLLLVSFSSLWLTSCCPEDPFVPNRPPVVIDSSAQGFVRFVVADPDVEDVEILAADSSLFEQSLGYLDYPEDIYEAEFWPVDTGHVTIKFLSASGSPVATTDIHLEADTYRTVYLFQDAGGHSTVVTHDEPKSSPGSSKVRYRVVNMAVGSPPVSVTFDDDPPSVTNLAYGDTSAIVTRSAAIVDKMVVTSESGNSILHLNNLVLFGDAVLTLVLTGKMNPAGDDPMLFLAIYQDNKRDIETTLYGDLPIPIRLCAVRFVNLVASGDSTLDLTFRDDQFGTAFPDNFRRNFQGQTRALEVPPLTRDSDEWKRSYFFHGTFLYSELPYRVEVHSLGPSQTKDVGSQTVLVGQQPFPIIPNKRSTVVAYGPFEFGQADAVTIQDAPPAPPPGQVGLRFVHGAFGEYEGEKLRLRVNGNSGTEMAYGSAPISPNDVFYAAASGNASMQVLDENNQVVYSQSGFELSPNKSYTVFFSNGASGNRFALGALSDDVIAQ